MGISEEENKRKKNRISAQISRDRKKQYFNSLISENQKLKNQNFLLEKENFELKDILDGRIYDNIKAVIEKSEINTLMSLLQEV